MLSLKDRRGIEMEKTDKKKVLIVDDESGVRQLVYRILSKDYAVLEARDGQEAIDIARAEKPHIILMDMMMPRMDGLTACHAIRTGETTKTIPIVMVTAVGHELNRKLSEEVMGANGYITKPFSPQVLLETLRGFFNGR
jgi:two-component system alkaline phosphatase synthesis response regulator PhoP